MNDYDKIVDFSKLQGHTIRKFENYDNGIVITTDTHKFWQNHRQECCESVFIEEVVGDVGAILNEPILAAWEETNSDDKQGANIYDSFTWTFYTIRTNRGTVVIRWLGESNGYYSEDVTSYMEPLK